MYSQDDEDNQARQDRQAQQGRGAAVGGMMLNGTQPMAPTARMQAPTAAMTTNDTVAPPVNPNNPGAEQGGIAGNAPNAPAPGSTSGATGSMNNTMGAPPPQQSTTQQWASKATQPASSLPQPDMPQIGARNPQWGDLYNQLMQRSKQSLNVDANDPLIKGQMDASNVIGQRNLQQDQQAAAERGGAYATGAVGNYARHAQEAFGAQQAQMQGQLMSREVDSRRQEIAQALSGMSGLLTAEEQSRLKQQDQALQAKQMQLSAQQNAWDNAYKDRSLAQSGALAGASNGIAQGNLDLNRDKFGFDQAQTLYNNNYNELFGG